MRRADRLFQIVQALRGGRLVTARRLSEDLEVSERTIYRDMADLIGSGVPVEGEAGVGYLLRSGYEMPPLMFTRAEITSLVAGARLIKAWGGLDMAKAAEEALIKIDAVLPDAVRNQAKTVQIHAFTWNEMDDTTRARLDGLDAAVEAKDRLSIEYEALEGAETTRVIRPLGLWFWGKVWTLVSWCEMREDFRMFRVDRIAAMQAVGKYRPERGKRLSDFYDSKDHG